MARNVRLPFLDGIRGWAALFVVLYHVFVNCFPIHNKHIFTETLIRVFIFNGPFAVWIFFIISGFALSIGFCLSREREGLMRIFYGRYVRLMIPILAISLIVYLGSRFQLRPPEIDRSLLFRNDNLFPIGFVDTLRFSLFDVFFNYRPFYSPVGPLWSMQYEFVGSLLVIFLNLVCGRLRYRQLIYALTFPVCVWFCPYIGAFVVGIILAELYVTPFRFKHAKALTVSLTICLGPLLYLSTRLPGGGDTFNLCFNLFIASLFTFFAIFERHCVEVMSGAVSRFLGKISYSLYLVHAPLLTFVGLHFLSLVPPLLFNIAAVMASVGCALLFLPVDRAAQKSSRLLQERCIQEWRKATELSKAWATWKET